MFLVSNFLIIVVFMLLLNVGFLGVYYLTVIKKGMKK
jgi:hypothetical protein